MTSSLAALFQVPRLYITVRGQTRSEAVLAQITTRLTKKLVGSETTSFQSTFLEGQEALPQECLVLKDAAAVQALFESGVSRDSVVAVFDQEGREDHYHTFTTCLRANNDMPKWASGCHWGIAVFPGCVGDHFQRNCGEQAAAHFNRNFVKNLLRGQFPWGKIRSSENPPVNVGIPARVRETLTRLNAGPNLAAAIADQACAAELPTGSYISWYRVSHDPIECDLQQMLRAVDAMAAFEPVCNLLASSDTDVQSILMAGVDVDPAVRDVYLIPKSNQFSVRRPDFHFTGASHVFASENDEMPGGMAELAFLDLVYGLNQERWKACFDWLTKDGRLLFLVSHVWSKCYTTEILWLTQYLQGLGYDVGMMTTENMDALTVKSDGVYDETGRIGTIWRQFPIFEARGKLVDLVLASHEGKVRMVPEFAHYGNKVWFSIFRSHNAFFRDHLDDATFRLLDKLLPDSHLVRSRENFPFSVEGTAIDSLAALCALPPAVRDGLVMKLSGANTLTARSYGVIMGHGLTQKTWSEWVDERIRLEQPFIVQRRLETGTIDLPVVNTSRDVGELFRCRVLLRPWHMGGQLVSVHACAVPSSTLRVHGRVDMCVPPILLV
jgi:hypothetical protein